MSDERLTTDDLAKRLKRSVHTIRKWRLRRVGPSYIAPSGPKGPKFYRLEDVEAWERRHTIETEAAG